MLQLLYETRMIVTKNTAELPRREIENSGSIGIHHVATITSDDHAIHERLKKKKVLAVALPQTEARGIRLRFQAIYWRQHSVRFDRLRYNDPLF